jgi:hypothetical protein
MRVPSSWRLPEISLLDLLRDVQPALPIATAFDAALTFHRVESFNFAIEAIATLSFLRSAKTI